MSLCLRRRLTKTVFCIFFLILSKFLGLKYWIYIFLIGSYLFQHIVIHLFFFGRSKYILKTRGVTDVGLCC